MMPSQRNCARREFLQVAAAGVGALALGAAASPRALGAFTLARKTKHVVLIAFAGGVRSKETLGTPANIPNLMRLAAGGVVLPNVAAENVGHYGAALSIFTGNTEVFGIRENARSDNPTVFEYLRRGLGLSANGVWLSTTGGDQQVNYSYGMHRKYGPTYGANLLSADGVFNAEFKDILEDFGRPKLPSEAEAALTAKLRGAIRAPGAPREDESAAAAATNQRNVEKFILDEISGKTVEVTGPGAADAKAIRVATNILRVFKPTLLGIALNQHDVAHQSFNGYVEIIRRNDSEIGRLFDAVSQDPELAESTAILVLPEFGRDRDLNERNGLDHGDGSEELGKVALFAYGPDFKRGKTVKDHARTIDVCPTVCRLLGANPEFAKGAVLKGMLA